MRFLLQYAIVKTRYLYLKSAYQVSFTCMSPLWIFRFQVWHVIYRFGCARIF